MMKRSLMTCASNADFGPKIALLAVVILLSPWQLLAQSSAYNVVEVSSSGEVARRLNDLGDFVGRGNSETAGTRATMWDHATFKRKTLGVFQGGNDSYAYAINEAGEVAGSSDIETAVVPFLWKPTGGLQGIMLLQGDNCGQAFGINKNGDVAGYSSGPNGNRACIWTRTTAPRNLGVLPGAEHSQACAINNAGEVVGTSRGPAGKRAVFWTKTGQIRDLGTLPGDTSSEAAAINNPGDVVGYSEGARGTHAFVWTKAAGMQDLGVLPGGNVSRALDINDGGDVVGISTSSSGDHAFIWTKQSGMTDLNSAASAEIGVLLIEAHAINNRGQILAMGKATPDGHADGALHGDDCAPSPPSTFLLTPTPAR